MTEKEVVCFISDNLQKIKSISGIEFKKETLETIEKDLGSGNENVLPTEEIKSLVHHMARWMLEVVLTRQMGKEDLHFFDAMCLFFYNISILYSLKGETPLFSSASKIVNSSYSFLDMIDVLKILVGKLEASVSFSNIEKEAANNFIKTIVGE